MSLFKEGISLPNMDYMWLSGINLVKVVIGQLQVASSFNNLKYMRVSYCDELSCITSTFGDTKLLQNLETFFCIFMQFG